MDFYMDFFCIHVYLGYEGEKRYYLMGKHCILGLYRNTCETLAFLLVEIISVFQINIHKKM